MPFTFNLQPLLDYRQRIEDEKSRDFAQGLAEKNRVEAILRTREQEYANSLAGLRNRLGNAGTRTMEDMFSEVTYLRDRITEAKHVVIEAEHKLVALRTALLEATREKNTMEKLKERRREKYLEARRLREEEEMDENNVIKSSNLATMKREIESL